MNGRNIFIAGLPDAGKTTFLAALWQLIFPPELETQLRYHSIEGLDLEYLNSIRDLWLAAKPLGRTKGASNEIAVLNLTGPDGQLLKLSIPDLAGEGFRRLWERRLAASSIVNAARNADGHLIMINAGQVRYPRTAEELRKEMEALDQPQGQLLPFNPRNCPTAPIIADILGSLAGPELGAGAKRVAIALSAWDEVADEGKSPDEILDERLPLVAQFIRTQAREREVKVFGVSAQGGDYKAGREAVLAKERPSERIILVDGDQVSHDLTRMLAWLLG